MTRLVAGEDSLSMEFGARRVLLEQLRVLARLALPLNDCASRVCLADMPDCPRCGSGLEEMALHAFYNGERVRSF